MKSKTKRNWICSLLALTVALMGFAVAACKGDVLQDGPEMGVYYYDARNDEYLITLSSGHMFTYSVDGENKSGTYALEGETLDLRFSTETDAQVSATLKDNVLTLEKDGSQMRFLKKITYTVTFDSEGGSAVGEEYVVNGKTMEKPGDPSKESHAFLGWYTDKEYEHPFIFGTQTVTGDLTLYARWAETYEGKPEYTINFDPGYTGAETPEPVKTIGQKLYELPSVEWEGHKFVGWWMSDYEDADKLTAEWTAETEFNANTTLYAVWTDNSASALPASPLVSVKSDSISWSSTGVAASYEYEVKGPSEFKTISGTVAATTVPVDFSNAPAGDYTITVKANGAAPTVRYYKNKALARVSLFSVIEPSTLLFNAVENAQKYYITVKCGNEGHRHEMVDNGPSTNYNFSNCEMKAGGIEFTVVAAANGYASSESEVFKYDRSLAAVTNLHVDEENQVVTWNSVPNAANYMVSVSCGNPAHDHSLVNVGSNTYFDLKECEEQDGGIIINVYPYTKGYNSPQPTSLTYHKNKLATPSNLKIKGTELSWSAIEGALSYEVRINGKTYPVTGTSVDIATLSGLTLSEGGDYTLSVRAKGTNDSAWSEPLDVRYVALSEALTYGKSVLSWEPVIGATRYQVKVNDGEAVDIEDGCSAPITLTKEGDNVLSVRFYNGRRYSDWVSITVKAYAVEFDTRKGSAVDPIYLATGDKVTLPTDTTLAGYDFDGWYNAPGGANGNAKEYTDEYYNENTGIMLYANWKPKSYTITYSYTEGTSGTDTVVYGENYRLDVPTPKDETSGFYGWFSAVNGMGTQYTDSDGKSVAPWTIASDMTVYPYWAEVLKFTPTYELDGTTVKEYSVGKGPYIDNVSKVTIPETYNQKPVTIVNALGFEKCKKLLTVEIPDSIMLVSSNAFQGCDNLQAVVVYESELLNNKRSEAHYASHDGALIEKRDIEDTPTNRLVFFPQGKTGSFSLPEEYGVKSIPTRTFASAMIEEVSLPASVTSIESQAFYQCKQLRSVSIEDVDGVAATELTFADRAFYDCTALTSVQLPKQTGELPLTGDKPLFSGCSSLESITITAGNTHYESLDGMLCQATKIVYCPKGKSGELTIPLGNGISEIGASAFSGCTKLEGVTIPGYITTIDTSAFSGCSALTYIKFSNKNAIGEVTIGSKAFSGCTKAETLTFEEGTKIVTIGQEAFSGAGVTVLHIPATVVKIDKNAFQKCAKLTEIFMDGTKDSPSLTLVAGAFDTCEALTTLHISANVTSMDSVFTGCVSLANLYLDPDNASFELVDGVLFNKGMTKLVFYPLGKAGDFELPETITEISKDIFQKNTSITGIVIPASVTKIAAGAFYNCTALETVTFLEPKEGEEAEPLELVNATSSSTGLFAGCSSLAEVHFPARLKALPDFVFFVGTSAPSNPPKAVLREVTFGDETHKSELTSIGKQAFIGQICLTEFDMPESVTTVGLQAFQFTGLKEVTVRKGVTYAYSTSNGIYAYLRDLEKITIEEGVTEIANGMFYGSSTSTYSAFLPTKVKKIVIPKTVTYVGSNAFSYMLGLEEIEFEEGGTEDIKWQFKSSPTTNPTNVTNIATGSGLKVIHFPARMTEVRAGYATNTLEEVTFGDETHPSQLVRIGDQAFQPSTARYDAEKPLHIDIPETVTEIALSAFYKTNITEITLPQKLEKLGNYVFREAQNLTSITIPKSVTSLGDGVFKDCVSKTNGVLITDENGEPVRGLETVIFEEGINPTFGTSVFSGCEKIKSVNIPASITSLGAVFSNLSNLETVTFSPGSKLESLKGTFNGCVKLHNVELPASVTSIGANTFSGCTALGEFNIPEKVTEIGASAFSSSGLAGEITIPAGVTVIPKQTFFACHDLTKVNFASDTALTEIGEQAFKSSGITEITIPSSVTTIGDRAFSTANSLKEIKLGANNKTFSVQDGVLYDYDKTKLIVCPGGNTSSVTVPYTVETIVIAAFYNVTGLASLTFQPTPEGTEAVGLTVVDATASGRTYLLDTSVFGGFGGVETVVFPERLVSLGAYAFYQTKVKYLRLPSTLTSIGKNAFSASGLVEVTFPTEGTNSIKEIGERAFEVSENLQKVDFGTTSEEFTLLSGYMFRQCSALESFTLPASITEIGAYAFESTTGLTTFTFVSNENLTTIGEYAFSKSGVTSLELPDSLTTIGNNVFQDASRLRTVTFTEESNLNSIGNYAFQRSALRSFVLPKGVTVVPQYGFDSCEALTTFTFADGNRLTETKANAFSNSGLTAIELPASFKTLGNNTFSNCAALETVSFPDTLGTAWPTLNASSGNCQPNNYFTNTTSLRKFIVTEGTGDKKNYSSDETGLLFNADKTILYYCPLAFTGTYKVPDGVQTIAHHAFYQHPGLTGITIPVSVASIENYAFGNGNSAPTTLLPLRSITFESADAAVGGGVQPLRFGSGESKKDNGDPALSMHSTYVFTYVSIGSLTLPKRLEYMGARVFTGCNLLTSVKFLGSLDTIPDYAFNNCTSLATVEFPEDLEHIRPNSFEATALTNVVIPEGVQRVWNGVFNKCSKLVSISLPSTLVALTSTGSSTNNSVFDGCTSLATVTFAPNIKLTKIEGKLFDNCTALRSIEIPASVTEIGSSDKLGNAFEGCTNLSSVTFLSDNTLKSIDGYAFKGCSSLTEIDIPDSVTYFGGSTFYGTGLKTLEIPAGVTALNASLFANSALEEITIPATVDTINSSAFENCTSLHTVTFEKNSACKKLSGGSLGGVFKNCTALETVVLPDSLEDLGEGAFLNCSSLANVTLPDTLTSIPNKAFSGCSSLPAIDIPQSLTLTAIGNEAFKGCSSLTTINIPGNVATVGNSAFEGCTGLQKVSFAVGVETLGDYAFSGDSNITELEIPASLLSVGANPFLGVKEVTVSILNDTFDLEETDVSKALYADGMRTLVSVLSSDDVFEIPDGVTKIGSGAFRSSDISVVFIPDTVTEIGDYAFAEAAKLRDVNFTGTDEPAEQGTMIGQYAFYDCDSLQSIEIPARFTGFGKYAFAESEKLATVKLPAGFTSLGTNTFQNCASLSSINMPESVKTVGNYVFDGCASLEEFDFSHLGGAALIIGTSAFQNSGIREVTLPLDVVDTCFGTADYTTSNLGTYAFEGCKNLTAVYNLGVMASNSFKNCVNLQTVEFSHSTVKRTYQMVDSAFAGCTSLRSLDMSMLVVTYMPSSSFLEGCTSLESFKYPRTYVGSSKTLSISASIFKDCTALREVQFPEIEDKPIDQICNHAFENCKLLTEEVLSFPSATQIGTYAFAGTGITEFTVGSTVTSLSSNAFTNCKELKTVHLDTGSKINKINSGLFDGCSALSTLTFGDTALTTIKTIGACAFRGCVSLASFTFTKAITTVQADVFSGWTADQKIYLATPRSELSMDTGTTDTNSSKWNQNWARDCLAEIIDPEPEAD